MSTSARTSNEEAAEAGGKGLAELYHQLLQDGVRLQKELEAYYLRQEGYIRKRVAVLDEIQENIADERRCLELQHQECRAQISAARKQTAGLFSEERRVSEAVQHARASLAVQEAEMDKRLEELEREKKVEDASLSKVLARQEELAQQEQQLVARERRKFVEEQDLQKALLEMRSLTSEMEERRKSLLRKRDTVAEWDRKLEARERELLACQEKLRENLKALEEEESVLGIHPAQRRVVTPAVSQRTVMDDHDMTIDHDSACEEIHYGD